MMNMLNLGSVRRGIRLALDGVADWRLNINTSSGVWTSIPRPGESRYAAWQAKAAQKYFPSIATQYHDSHPNIPISWPALRTFVDQTLLQPNDVFYDIGCGRGRVLCHVARKNVQRCVGVELSPQFGEEAKINAKRLRGRMAPVEVMIGDAAEMDYSDGTVFFLFNPFGADTLRKVLDNIGQTLIENPRRILVIYVNGAHREVVASTSWLTYVGERKVFYTKQRAEYWSHSPVGTAVASYAAVPDPLNSASR